VEIQEALEDLMRAHRAPRDNFYEEPPVARRLRDVVGRHREVPGLLTAPYVATLVNVFLTNGYGIAWNAEPYYIELIKRFDGPQPHTRSGPSPSRRSSRSWESSFPRRSGSSWCQLVAPKLTEREDRVLLERVRAFTGTPDKLRMDTKIAAQLKVWREAKGL
jgi:hypothetical protein